MKRPLPLLGALLAGFCVAPANLADPVTIKLTPTVGQKLSYNVTGHLTFAAQGDVDVTLKTSNTVTAIGADGNLSIETTQSDLTVNDMPYPVPADAIKAVAKPTGEVISFEGPAGASIRLENISRPYYPANPVNVGDSWTVDIKPQEKTDAIAASVTLKLVGDEKIKDIDTWKIEETGKENSKTMPASAKTTFWVKKSDGTLVKEIDDFTDAPIGPGIATGKMTSILAPAG